MSRILRVAAVQMDATPMPVEKRLERAADLIAEAASSGALMIVLPEVFNTGYEYTDTNYGLAETINGRTVTWMRQQAREHGVHLLGSLLLRDQDEVYNSAILLAPDGRFWRYDKNFPWAWERAYFREGRGITVAETDLGNFGLMICHDYTHPELWERYAGQVDAMLLTSCPPVAHKLSWVFPDGTRRQFDDKLVYVGDDEPFGKDLDEKAAWMGVPLINTTGAGRFSTPIPNPRLTLNVLMANEPNLWGKIQEEADKVRFDGGYFNQTKVVDAHGNVLSRVDHNADGFTLADITLEDQAPQPKGDMPPNVYTPLMYMTSDHVVPPLMIQAYRQGYRKQFGKRMAPLQHGTKVWGAALVAAAGASAVVGWTAGRLRRMAERRQLPK
ncbi:MAG: carbon-nitrogen hydrolase family protein [Aggregatilineales bacterium]